MEDEQAVTGKPETDVDLPRALIKRIVKNKLSALSGDDSKEFQVSKDALTALAESTKVFISLIASTANDICQEKRRSTVNADDVFNALQDLDFSELICPLKEQLEAFKEVVRERNKNRPSKKRKNVADVQHAVPRNVRQQQQAVSEPDVQPAVGLPEGEAGPSSAGATGLDELGPDAEAVGLGGGVLSAGADDDGLEGLGLGLGDVGVGDAGGLGMEGMDMLVDGRREEWVAAATE